MTKQRTKTLKPPTTAMVLAAGYGTRMRPLTDTLPKPLVRVLDRALIDRVLDRLEDAMVEKAVVNVHYLGEQIEKHLKSRTSPKIDISREEELLDTGGGIIHALSKLGKNPFYAVNSDALWLNGYKDALLRLAQHWDDTQMDGLLLLHSTVEAYGYDGMGDFVIDPLGGLQRRPEGEVSPYLFTGVQMLHPRLFKNAPSGPFSMNRLYDEAIEVGRLYGVIHDGEWFHVGTVESLKEAEDYIQARYAGTRHRS
ncbi:MAG: nucleotidyltransferase family protein [Rhodospirillaceae bacterium]|jgi:MurNAc alpha-1-phosphate uridylyltransferase